MSASSPSKILLEYHGYAVRGAVVRGTELLDYRECSVEDAAGCTALLSALRERAGSPAPAVFTSLASGDQVLRLITAWPPAQGGATWLTEQAGGALDKPNAVVIDARSGTAPLANKPSVVAGVPATASEAMYALLTGAALQAGMDGVAASPLALGAVAQTVTPDTTVAVWELAGTPGTLALVEPSSVRSIVTCPIGWEQVVEAVQKALNLRFRTAAVKLLFNDLFDFSEVGPKVAETVAPAIRTALDNASGKATAFYVAGLPGRQSWLTQHIAGALGLPVWQPDLADIARQRGVTIGADAFSGTPSPAALSAIYWASLKTPSGPWCINWRPANDWKVEAAAPAAPAKAAPAPAKSAPVQPTKAAPAPKKQEAVVVEVTPAKTREEPKKAAVATATATATKAAVAAAPAARVETAPAKTASSSEKAATAEKAAATPPPAKTGGSTKYEPEAGAPAAKRPNKKLGLMLGIAAALIVALVVAGKFYSDAQNAQAAAEAERIAAEARMQEMAAKAAAETERLQREAEAERESAIAATRAELEEEARRQLEAERLQHAPGTLILVTRPAGATVSIDGGRAHTTPLRLTDVRPGSRALTITLAGYDTVTLSAEVQGTRTTDLGTIELVRQVGSVAITSTPAGLPFELRGNPSNLVLQSGTTPAVLESIAVGTYDVVVTRTGYPSARETIQVQRNDRASVTPAFYGGRVLVESAPAGAEVRRNGEVLGVTPLELNDVTPDDIELTLHLAEHEEARLGGRVEAAQTLRLTTRLEPIEKLVRLTDLAVLPLPTKRVNPELDRSLGIRSGRVFLSFIIDETGIPRDIRVEEATDARLVDVSIQAMEQWRFSPGRTNDGQPARTRLHQVFNFGRD